MIPFAVPRNNFLLNLTQIVTAEITPESETTEYKIKITTADGKLHFFTGDAAHIVGQELIFCLNSYQQMRAAMHQQSNGRIITPDSSRVN